MEAVIVQQNDHLSFHVLLFKRPGRAQGRDILPRIISELFYDLLPVRRALGADTIDGVQQQMLHKNRLKFLPKPLGYQEIFKPIHYTYDVQVLRALLLFIVDTCPTR